MAVLVEALSVIVGNEVLEDLYPGGVEGYRNDCPNSTFCTDGHITCVKFMDLKDVNIFISQLEEHNLLFMHREKSWDIAVVDEAELLSTPCDWLKLDRNEDGIMFCWLSSLSPGEILAPEDWTKDRRVFRIGPKELQENFRYIKTEDNLDVYEDCRTGKLHYKASPFFNRDVEMRYERMVDIETRLFELTKMAEKSRNENDGIIGCEIETELQDLSNAAKQLKEEDGPLEAVSRFTYGLSLRILEKWEEAEYEYRTLVTKYPDEINGWLELTGCLRMQGKLEEEEQAAYRAIHVAPGSAAAWGNFAFTLIKLNRKDEARTAIEKAIVLDPDNQKNRYIFENFDRYFIKKGN